MKIDALSLPPQLKVRRRTLLNDLLTGLIMAVVSIPNGLGGSVLAGVNPAHGLYSLVIATPVAAILTSSVLMNVDATSATALATRDALAGIRPDERVAALVMLVVLVGVFQIIFGMLRLGKLVRFISNAVMTGFLTGIATLTVLGQVGSLTAYASPYSNRVVRLVDTLVHLDQIDLQTLLVGLGTIALIYGLNRTRLQRFSIPIGLALATVVVPLLNLDSVPLVGHVTEVPRSLPTLQALNLGLIPEMFLPALAIAITALVQASGVSQSYPNPDGRYPDASRDFLGQGIGNFAAGLFAGLPAGGSLSGTAMVASLGARSRWANIFTGVFVAGSLLLLAPLINLLPESALAGMLIVVGISMFNLPRIQLAWKTGRVPQTIMLLTFVSTLVMPIQYAVFLGVALHIVLHIYHSAERTRLIQIVPLEDGGLQEVPAPAQLSGGQVIILQPVGSLFFAGAAEVENLLPEVGTEERNVVILRLRIYDEIGSTFLGVVERFSNRLRTNDGRLMLAGVSSRVLEQLETTGIAEQMGRENIFPAQPRFGEALFTALDQARMWAETQ